MVEYKPGLLIPEVAADICVGCGACEYACPTLPNRAIFVNGHAVHQVASEPLKADEQRRGTRGIPVLNPIDETHLPSHCHSF